MPRSASVLHSQVIGGTFYIWWAVSLCPLNTNIILQISVNTRLSIFPGFQFYDKVINLAVFAYFFFLQITYVHVYLRNNTLNYNFLLIIVEQFKYSSASLRNSLACSNVTNTYTYIYAINIYIQVL